MAIDTPTVLTNGSDTVDAASFTTASVTPASNKLVLVAVVNSKGSAPTTPTISGNGITYTQVNTVAFYTIATPQRRLTLFQGLNASPSAGAITIDFAGATQTNCIWAVIEIGNVNTTTPVVQSAVNSVDDSASALVVTLAAFADVANGAVGVFSWKQTAAGAGSMTPGGGFTELTDATSQTPLVGLETEYIVTNDTTVDATPAASSAMGGIACEVAAAAAATFVPRVMVF